MTLNYRNVRYETHPRMVVDWMAEIRNRHLVLPRFQRMEAWTSEQVRELLQSVVEGMPAGSILLLGIGDKPLFSWRPLAGAPTSGQDGIRELLLDGQQRLTALWRALHDHYLEDEDPTRWYQFFVRLWPDEKTDPDDLPLVVKERYYERDGRRYPLWPNDPRDVLRRGFIPFSLLNPDAEAKVQPWIEQATAGTDRNQMELMGTINRYRLQVREFNMPYIRLGSDTELKAVVRTFEKVNTQGTPLNAFDLTVARLELEDIDLHSLVRTLRDSTPALSWFKGLDDLETISKV